MAEKPKDLTYGQLVNIRTKLGMLNKATGNGASKHVLPDGTKLGMKAVEKKIAALDARPGKKTTPAKPVPVKGMPSAGPAAKMAKKAAAAKPTATPKAKPKLSQSEKDFLAGQKLKAKIMKKTGVYPNTAN